MCPRHGEYLVDLIDWQADGSEKSFESEGVFMKERPAQVAARFMSRRVATDLGMLIWLNSSDGCASS